MHKLLSKSLLLSSTVFFSLVSLVYANGDGHEGEHDELEQVEEAVVPTLEEIIRSNSIKVVFFASIIIIVAVILTILLKDRGEGVRKEDGHFCCDKCCDVGPRKEEKKKEGKPLTCEFC